jgi:glyoxylase-like metal-dependent hydrolase (beta-lactamase superfamily II)
VAQDVRGHREPGRRVADPLAGIVPTTSALEEQGYASADIDFALPTHAHWDHVCGLLDLPGLPLYLHRTEHDWVTTGSVAPVGGVRDSLDGRTTIDYDLDGPPVLLPGDAAWHTYQVEYIRQKSSYPGGLADEDRAESFRTLHRLHAIKDRVMVVPTHDPDAAKRLREAQIGVNPSFRVR